MGDETTSKKSFLYGLDDLAEKWLNVENKFAEATGWPTTFPRYNAKAVYQGFVTRGPKGVPTNLDLAMWMSHIEANRQENIGSRNGQENWRQFHQLKISKANGSAEKKLEKNIARLESAYWFNQIPVCSGYVRKDEKKAAVDLYRLNAPDDYTLIELKWKSNNPLFAAIEILKYFMAYVFTRKNLKLLGYDTLLATKPILTAERISLAVLAPRFFYQLNDKSAKKLADLGWFEAAITSALIKFSDANPDLPRCSQFQFLQFPHEFDYEITGDDLQCALDAITPVYK